MEYMDNKNLLDLKRVIKKVGINKERLMKIFLKCLHELEYIHSNGIIHRDIKLAIIIMGNKDQVKFFDFKMVKFFNSEKAKFLEENNDLKNKLIINNVIIGSDKIKTPELSNEPNCQIKYNEKIDAYSMGIVFCSFAYQSTSLPEKYENISYSKQLYNIIKKMLDKEESTRPNSSEIK